MVIMARNHYIFIGFRFSWKYSSHIKHIELFRLASLFDFMASRQFISYDKNLRASSSFFLALDYNALAIVDSFETSQKWSMFLIHQYDHLIWVLLNDFPKFLRKIVFCRNLNGFYGRGILGNGFV